MTIHSWISATDDTFDVFRRHENGPPDTYLGSFLTHDEALDFARDYAVANRCDMLVRRPAVREVVDAFEF